jgi:hypothetical protein
MLLAAGVGITGTHDRNATLLLQEVFKLKEEADGGVLSHSVLLASPPIIKSLDVPHFLLKQKRDAARGRKERVQLLPHDGGVGGVRDAPMEKSVELSRLTSLLLVEERLAEGEYFARP